MSSQVGVAMSIYGEVIERLKEELKDHVASARSSNQWDHAEKLYHALRSMQELTGAPKTTLEELVGLIAPATLAVAMQGEKIPELALGEQQEPEAATEIERGA
jgi:hypothetical protein